MKIILLYIFVICSIRGGGFCHSLQSPFKERFVYLLRTINRTHPLDELDALRPDLFGQYMDGQEKGNLKTLDLPIPISFLSFLELLMPPAAKNLFWKKGFLDFQKLFVFARPFSFLRCFEPIFSPHYWFSIQQHYSAPQGWNGMFIST